MDQPEYIRVNLGESGLWEGDLLLVPGVYEGESILSPGKDVGDIRITGPIEDKEVIRALISLGTREKIKPDTIRKVGGFAARWLTKNNIKRAAIEPEALKNLPFSFEQAFQAFCEGLYLGGFTFGKYKSKQETPGEVPTVTFFTGPSSSEDPYQKILDRTNIICQAVNLSRAWAHEPPNSINPVTLAARVEELASGSDLQLKILDDSQLKEMGANAIVAVGQGSNTPSRLIVLEYAGQNKEAKPVVLVGKAITFDTGGYNIKPGEGMLGMKYDKCAGMDVIALVKAAAELKVNNPVVGIVAAAENMISGKSYRPNDIIHTLGGKTVEVISADAEGRMVLCDALTYAQQQYKPQTIIDMATLTGGVVTALGKLRAGIMGNNDHLITDLIQLGEETHERLWQLPLDEEYLDLIKGDDSDIKNSGSREATAIVGGIFLKQFVGDEVPWAHIDIAGVSGVDKDMPYCPKGATGFGVRLLLNYLMQLG